MKFRACVVALVFCILSSGAASATNTRSVAMGRGSITSLKQDAEREQAGLVWMAIKWVFGEFVAPKMIEWVKSFVDSEFKAHGRKVVAQDTGNDVETAKFGLKGRDTDGDGKADSYAVHSEVEDHDGDGVDDDPIDEDATPDIESLKADLRDEVARQDQWLRDHGR